MLHHPSETNDGFYWFWPLRGIPVAGGRALAQFSLRRAMTTVNQMVNCSRHPLTLLKQI